MRKEHFNLLQTQTMNDYLETYDFMATSRKNAEKKMEAVIKSHATKYKEILKIQNLRLINHNLWRCNLTLSHKLTNHDTL